MSHIVFDTSALLQLMDQGSADPRLADAMVSAVAVAEVLEVLISRGVALPEAMAALMTTGIHIVDYSYEHATAQGRLFQSAPDAAYSAAERAGMALALVLDATLVTADPALLAAAGLGVRVAAL